MRRDINTWLSLMPSGVVQVANEAVSWRRGWMLRGRVFDLGSALHVVTYTEPRLDNYAVIPDFAWTELQRLLEPYRLDPRPWIVTLWDPGVSYMERPTTDGRYEKVYFGPKNALEKVKQHGDGVGPIDELPLSSAVKMVDQWMGAKN